MLANTEVWLRLDCPLSGDPPHFSTQLRFLSMLCPDSDKEACGPEIKPSTIRNRTLGGRLDGSVG